jgi:predicted DNA-binding transcriptional regulator AlpA
MSILKPSEAAALLRLSPRTLDRLRVEGGGPRFLKVRQSIRYRLADINSWLDRRAFGSTSEAGVVS